jgi:broad specificity phosphatase PhoE
LAIRFYLIREGNNDPTRSTDPYNIALTSEGIAEMRRWATCSKRWGLDMLCSSTLRAARETSDLFEQDGHVPVRWDLTELEDLVLDDLNYDPRATHLVATWTPEQLEQGLIALWTRLIPAYARISLYAETYGVKSVAIVSSERVLNLLLDHFLEADWRMVRQARFSFDSTPVCCVTVSGDAETAIEWLVCSQEGAQ